MSIGSPDLAPVSHSLVIGDLTLVDVLTRTAAVRPVFHSEADFQHHLAWVIRDMDPQVGVRLETRPLPNMPLQLDLLLSRRASSERVAVELKYSTRKLIADYEGERFHLRDHAAQDVRRHDVVKDIERIELLVKSGVVDSGWVLALTNDRGYWNAAKRDTVDAAFRIHEGRQLTGRLEWAAGTANGTKASREHHLELTGQYTLTWLPYSNLTDGPAGTFRILAVHVSADAAITLGPLATAEKPLRKTKIASPEGRKQSIATAKIGRLHGMIEELRTQRSECEPKNNGNQRYLHYSNAVSHINWIIQDLQGEVLKGPPPITTA
jgi:hypothetical protein